jgi:DNA-binding response OmpR family regulator
MMGISLGARHYVQKPFSIVDLLTKVATSIR